MKKILQNNDKKGDIIELSDSESEYSISESEDKNQLNEFNICNFCEDNEIEFSCQTCFSRICYLCRSRCSECMETICPDCETDEYLCKSCLENSSSDDSDSDSD
jgi:hypothetical protein